MRKYHLLSILSEAKYSISIKMCHHPLLLKTQDSYIQWEYKRKKNALNKIVKRGIWEWPWRQIQILSETREKLEKGVMMGGLEMEILQDWIICWFLPEVLFICVYWQVSCLWWTKCHLSRFINLNLACQYRSFTQN